MCKTRAMTIPGYMMLAFAFATGSVVGSFVTLVADRWPRGEDWVSSCSRCQSCGRRLRPAQMIPLISFAMQSGRCRWCGVPLPADLWLGELGGGVVAMLALSCGESGAAIAVLAVFGWALLLLALLDARHLWLPDAVTLPLCIAGLASAALLPAPPLPERILGAALGYASLELVRRTYCLLRGREGLGGGDPKLLAAIGAWLGATALPLIVLCAALLGLIWAGILTMRKTGIDNATPLPLGAFLAVTAICAMPFIYQSVQLVP